MTAALVNQTNWVPILIIVAVAVALVFLEFLLGGKE